MDAAASAFIRNIFGTMAICAALIWALTIAVARELG